MSKLETNFLNQIKPQFWPHLEENILILDKGKGRKDKPQHK